MGTRELPRSGTNILKDGALSAQTLPSNPPLSERQMAVIERFHELAASPSTEGLFRVIESLRRK